MIIPYFSTPGPNFLWVLNPLLRTPDPEPLIPDSCSLDVSYLFAWAKGYWSASGPNSLGFLQEILNDHKPELPGSRLAFLRDLLAWRWTNWPWPGGPGGLVSALLVPGANSPALSPHAAEYGARLLPLRNRSAGSGLRPVPVGPSWRSGLHPGVIDRKPGPVRI